MYNKAPFYNDELKMAGIQEWLEAKDEPSIHDIEKALKKGYAQYEKIDTTRPQPLIELAHYFEEQDQNKFNQSKIYRALYCLALAAKRFNDINAYKGIETLVKKYLFFYEFHSHELMQLHDYCHQQRITLLNQKYIPSAHLSFDPELYQHASLLRTYYMTLAERLDLAFLISDKCSLLLAKDQTSDVRSTLKSLLGEAQHLIEAILNTQDDNLIRRYRQQRAAYKNFNPDFIPGRAPRSPTKISNPYHAKNIQRYKWRRFAHIALGYQKKKLLAVTESAKETDINEQTHFLNPLERSAHQVVIKDGKFLERQIDNQFTPVDTKGRISHRKPGFSAYTINLNGEISLFNHFQISDGFAHSSMNAQAPLFISGEVQITQGELRAITVHSMHYRPAFLNLYLVLNYFKDQGVDISQTILKTWGLDNEKKYNKFIEYPALDFLANYNPDNNTYQEPAAFDDFEVDFTHLQNDETKPNQSAFFTTSMSDEKCLTKAGDTKVASPSRFW